MIRTAEMKRLTRKLKKLFRMLFSSFHNRWTSSSAGREEGEIRSNQKNGKQSRSIRTTSNRGKRTSVPVVFSMAFDLAEARRRNQAMPKAKENTPLKQRAIKRKDSMAFKTVS
jgi:hypothetical protein